MLIKIVQPQTSCSESLTSGITKGLEIPCQNQNDTETIKRLEQIQVA